MAYVVVRLKILPTEVGLDLNRLAEAVGRSLPQDMSIIRRGEEPIAFGLVALILDVKAEDKGGVMDGIEEAVRSVKGVSQIQVLAVSRLSSRIG